MKVVLSYDNGVIFSVDTKRKMLIKMEISHECAKVTIPSVLPNGVEIVRHKGGLYDKKHNF